MSYRNKTYVVLDYDNDHKHYNIMRAWKSHENIDFNFHNAHEFNEVQAHHTEAQIKQKLRERMNNSKQVIVLVGEKTKYNHTYVRWEQELAINQNLPIIAVNIDGHNGSTKNTPPILMESAYFLSVPFEMRKIKYALNNFPENHAKYSKNGPARKIYIWDDIQH